MLSVSAKGIQAVMSRAIINVKYFMRTRKMADRQGFEPWIGYSPMPVFKTGAFNRSAICPQDNMIRDLNHVQNNHRKAIRKPQI